MMNKKTALITGISSQDGAYLAKFLLENNYKVWGLVREKTKKPIFNLEYLKIYNDVQFEFCDLLDLHSVSKVLDSIKPDEVYNFSAQSSVGISFQDPMATMHFNCMSVINLLEALRLSEKKFRFFQPVSSEMYGKCNSLPISETTCIQPSSPYATSKAFAYWAVNNYREAYKLFATSGILFNHESFLRSNNFFLKKVILGAIKIRSGESNQLFVGNIDVKRDMGFAPEYVKAMWLMLQANVPDDFIISSGQSVLLRDIINYVFDKLNISRDKIIVDPKLYRPVEVLDLFGDSSKIRTKLNWQYNYSFYQLLDHLIEEEIRYGSVKG